MFPLTANYFHGVGSCLLRGGNFETCLLAVQADGDGGVPVQADGDRGVPVQADGDRGVPVQADGDGGVPVQADGDRGVLELLTDEALH